MSLGLSPYPGNFFLTVCFYCLCMGALLVCISMCAMLAVLTEARKISQIAWNRNYRWFVSQLLMLRIEHGSCAKAVTALTAESSLSFCLTIILFQTGMASL